MALTTRPKTIPERLQDTFPPITKFDGSFADALRRIADRLDSVEESSGKVVRDARRKGMNPEECLAIIEAIAMVAALDDITITAATSSLTDGGMEVRFTLQGEQTVVEGLATMIGRSNVS